MTPSSAVAYPAAGSASEVQPLARSVIDPHAASDTFARRVAMVLVAASVLFSLVPLTLSFNASGMFEPTHGFAEGSQLRQFQYGSLFVTALWLAWRRHDWTLHHIRHMNPFLWMVVLYCFATIFWSDSPMVSFKRSVLLTGLVLVGLATAPPNGDSRQNSRVLMVTLTVLIAISAVVALAVPRIGVDYDLGGAWRGIMWQKNTLGSVAGFCLILWLRHFLTRPGARGRALLGLMLSAVVLVMSKSTTAVLVTALGLGLYLLYRRRRIAGARTPLFIGVAAMLALLAALHFTYVLTGDLPSVNDIIEPVTRLLDKSPDFTGRGDIWRLVLLSVQQHPIWGIGYGAFWLGQGSPAQYIADFLTWFPTHGHNGYIDILNELGAVGMAITVALLLWHLRQIVKLLHIDREEGAIHLAFLGLILASNFSESQLMSDVAFQNIIIFYSSTTVSAILDMQRPAGTA